MRAGSIVFSQYLSNLICGGSNNHCQVIYHGAEPSSKIIYRPSKKDARAKFSLPEGSRIPLALGYKTATKSWDVFKNMNIPDG